MLKFYVTLSVCLRQGIEILWNFWTEHRNKNVIKSGYKINSIDMTKASAYVLSYTVYCIPLACNSVMALKSFSLHYHKSEIINKYHSYASLNYNMFEFYLWYILCKIHKFLYGLSMGNTHTGVLLNLLIGNITCK